MCKESYVLGFYFYKQHRYKKEKIYDSFDTMAESHPFLRSVIKYEAESTKLFYDIRKHLQIKVYEGRVIKNIWDDYKEVGAREWNVFENGLLKVFLYPHEKGFKMLFVGHHLLGNYATAMGIVCKSKAAKFVGANMFGYEKRDGISITNLGSIHNPNIKEAIFIPPALPATIQTLGVLTVNDKMQLCSGYYEKAISGEEVKAQLSMLIKKEGEYGV